MISMYHLQTMSIKPSWNGGAGWNTSHVTLPTATAMTQPAPIHDSQQIVEGSVNSTGSPFASLTSLCIPTDAPLHYQLLVSNHTTALGSPRDSDHNITVHDPRSNGTGLLSLAGSFLVEYRLDCYGKGWFCYKPKLSSSPCEAKVTSTLTTEVGDHRQNSARSTSSSDLRKPTDAASHCQSTSSMNDTGSIPSRTNLGLLNTTGIIESSMAVSTLIVPTKFITILILMVSGLVHGS
jgi:hypothetical protein